MPPLAWDCLTYHLTFAALWIQKGTLFIFHAPDQIADNAYFPINGDIFASWLLLPFNSDLLVNIMNFPVTLLGGIACYAIARELGLGRRAAAWAPALICFSPVIYSQVTTALSENSLFAFYVAGVLFTLRYLLNGRSIEGVLAAVSAGMLIGIKQTGIPAAGIIFIAIATKALRTADCSGAAKKSALLLSSLIIIVALGGRQYILNSIDARNPLYPFPVTALNQEIFAGSLEWEQHGQWVMDFEQKSGLVKRNWWTRELRRLCYIKDYYSTYPITAGPKFLLLLILAIASLFVRPPGISRRHWYFLSLLWIVPAVLFYSTGATNIARKGPWVEYSTRFLSPLLALVAILSLVVIERWRRHFRGADFFLAALVGWDLLYVNATHLWEIRALYPAVALIVPALVIAFSRASGRGMFFFRKVFPVHEGRVEKAFPGLPKVISRQCIPWALAFVLFVAVLSALQHYRDTTRYVYFQNHYDHQQIPTALISGWELLDRLDDPKTVAMTMGDEPPDGHWFFYPLLGRRFQNQIVYVSAKHNREVPAWFDRGFIRGEDFSIWLNNVQMEKVDYILVAKPWPIELLWMLRQQRKVSARL